MLSPIDQERERTEQWRRLALMFDHQRIQALSLLRATIAEPHRSFSDEARQANEIRKFLETPPDLATHLHRNRNSKYIFLGFGNLQSMYWVDSRTPTLLPYAQRSVDMAPLAFYRSVDDYSLWARPKEEWEDGRFIQL